ncbi:MAG TPA: hypothetical protein VFY39_12435, partial [Gammaproteobacteria bacterium]|nr:hypothetical protein [Gammaproteobacteria bacterium]
TGMARSRSPIQRFYRLLLRCYPKAFREEYERDLGAIVTLALGIGATTAMFSVVDAVLLRPLPFRETDRLVELVGTKPLEAITAFDLSIPDFLSWQERTRSFTAMAALEERTLC